MKRQHRNKSLYIYCPSSQSPTRFDCNKADFRLVTRSRTVWNVEGRNAAPTWFRRKRCRRRRPRARHSAPAGWTPGSFPWTWAASPQCRCGDKHRVTQGRRPSRTLAGEGGAKRFGYCFNSYEWLRSFSLNMTSRLTWKSGNLNHDRYLTFVLLPVFHYKLNILNNIHGSYVIITQCYFHLKQMFKMI